MGGGVPNGGPDFENTGMLIFIMFIAALIVLIMEVSSR